jgi:hypothetical protein
MKQITAVLVLLLLALASCSRPAGPVETIGRGLDQVMDGTEQLNEKYKATPTPTPIADSEGNFRAKPVETAQEKADRERKEFESRHDYDSDEWWREHDRRIEAEGY